MDDYYHIREDEIYLGLFIMKELAKGKVSNFFEWFHLFPSSVPQVYFMIDIDKIKYFKSGNLTYIYRHIRSQRSIKLNIYHLYT